MLSQYKPKTEKILHFIVHHIPYVEPNYITILGCGFSILFFTLIQMHLYNFAIFVYILAAFDMLDGAIARIYKKETVFGGFLDSTLDRVSDFLIITAFSFAHIVRWEITAPLLLFSFLTSYIRSRAELSSKSQISVAIGLIERPERILIIGLGIVAYMLFSSFIFYSYNLLEIIFIILALFSLITVIQRMWFAYKNL